MNLPTAPFYSGSAPANPAPLSRYLPPVLEGAVTAWLKEALPFPPGGAALPWVLDPFGASPRACLEAARAGYRVLVAANNPIARFLIEMAAQPPSEAEFQAALAELASSNRGEERMEPHIRGLYHTTCSQCARTVEAEAFLWEKGADAPYARLYTCPACGQEGEFPATATDADRARHFGSGGLHRARALERIAAADDPDRQHAEEALAVYLPRAVYALFTLINKLDGLNLDHARRDRLCALLLSACDQANTLWQHPARRERPRQLSVPTRFRENNIWLALERAVTRWATGGAPVPLSLFPHLLPAEGGGICLFEGPLRDLSTLIEQDEHFRGQIGAVLAPMPRPNQAFWTLSALWAGWLWGRSSVGPFKSVLRRRRYDWAWYAAGVAAAFTSLKPILNPRTPVFGWISEAESGFVASALLGADLAGFELAGLALRSDPAQAQIHWQPPQVPAPPPLPTTDFLPLVDRAGNLAQGAPAGRPESRLFTRQLAQAAGESAQAFLHQLGQPAQHLPMHTAAQVGIIQAHLFRLAPAPQAAAESAAPTPAEPSPADDFNQAQGVLRDLLTYRGGFLRFGGSEAIETGSWWLRDPGSSTPPLADRLEKFLVTFLLRRPGSRFEDLEAALNLEFRGLLTPSLELVHVCLDSYAAQEPPESGLWRLRPQEEPAARRQDLDTVYGQLKGLAERLGYTQEGVPPVWFDENGKSRLWFYPIASAVIGEVMLGKPGSPASPAARSIIVLPGGRANLLAYKLRRDPRLADLCAKADDPAPAGWRFLKYRHLRQLLDHPMLLRENFEALLSQDPLTYTAPQMRLF